MITRQYTIQEIFEKHPQKAQRLGQELTATGLHCVGCGAATWETVEAGCYGHGMDDTQIDALIERLNAILVEKTDISTISMTPRAAERFLAILKEEGKAGWGLRFEDKPGGCGGFEYSLDYSEKAQPNDITFPSHGIEIHVPTTSLERLRGCEIDFVDALMGGGFKITNPNARSSCSCGTSHNY